MNLNATEIKHYFIKPNEKRSLEDLLPADLTEAICILIVDDYVKTFEQQHCFSKLLQWCLTSPLLAGIVLVTDVTDKKASTYYCQCSSTLTVEDYLKAIFDRANEQHQRPTKFYVLPGIPGQSHDRSITVLTLTSVERFEIGRGLDIWSPFKSSKDKKSRKNDAVDKCCKLAGLGPPELKDLRMRKTSVTHLHWSSQMKHIFYKINEFENKSINALYLRLQEYCKNYLSWE